MTATALLLLPIAGAMAANPVGVILNAETDEPLQGATVLVANSSQVLLSDAEGRFVVESGGSEPVMVTVSYVGFATISDLVLRADRESVIRLVPSATVLDRVVVTANRYERQAYKVTQPITAVGATEIENKGYGIVADVIRNFPGLDMNDAGPFRSRPVIRGLFGTRLLVLVDGVRLNDQRDNSSFAGVSMSLVDVNEIERVEVVNGPASVLYGSDAMGGVINIITRKNDFAAGINPFAAYSGRYSTADRQHSNRIDIGVNAERWSASVGYQYREADKDFKPPSGWNEKGEYFAYRPEFYDSLNAATGRNFSRDRMANSRARIANWDFRAGYKPAEGHRLDIDLGVFRGNDIGYPGVPNDSTPFFFFYPNHDRDNVAVKWTARNLTERLARLETQVYYEKISKDFLTDFLGSLTVPAGPGMTITPLTSLNRTEVTKLGLNFQELYGLSEQSRLTFGFDFLREEIDGEVTSVTRFDGFGPFPFEDTTVGSSVPQNNWNSLGVYASGELEYASLLATLGLRYDNFWVNTDPTPGYVDDDDQPLPTENDHYDAVNVSLGLVHRLGDGVNLVANLGTAYRVPNVVERFYYGSASNRETRPNPDIKPERSISYDFGIKAVHEHANYSLIGFYSSYDDFSQLRIFDSLAGPGGSEPLWRFENIDEVTIYGFEGVLEGSLDNGLYGSLSFTYQHGQNETFDQPLFVSPIKTSVTLGYRHEKHGLFGEMTLRRVEDQDRVPDVTYLDDIPTRGFSVVSATAGVRLFERVRLSVTVNNLFDEIYSEPFNARNPDNPVAEPGRNFVLSLNSSI
jgi:hemoglobin/transferrin/lactoferrin receptor protein